MPDRKELETLFLANLDTIERLAHAIGRRHALTRDEIDDFASLVKAKFVENDYAALARFRGESSLTTYLAVVVAMAFRDYRVQRWGRWRPSARARSAGPLAVRLETLIYRDGCSLDEAAATLRSTTGCTLTNRELAALVSTFPRRAPLRPHEVGEESLAQTSITDVTDSDGEDPIGDVEHTRRAVAGALRTLSAEDRLILRMRYWEGLTIADVARALDLPQKSLYRRIDHILAGIRERLGDDGPGAGAASRRGEG